MISGKTAVYGLIGDPVEHSLSPAMQNAAFKALDLDCVFLAFKVSAADVEDALLGMRSLAVQGLNVTMPHKSSVIPHLDEIDETAKLLDSVNTILNHHGKLRGFSTDGAGARHALEENGANLSGKRLVLLGAGGAAKAIAYELAKEVSELILLNRTPAKTEPLAQVINEKINKNVVTGSLSPEIVQKSLRDADILINATSTGMHPRPTESLVKPAWLKPNLVVMEIVYNPLETKLTRDAKRAGAKVISGLEMLIYQGATSFEIWTGKPAPVEIMRKAAQSQIKGGDRHQ